MSWREKLAVLAEEAASRSDLISVFELSGRGTPESVQASVRRDCEESAGSYVDFLAITDGAQLDHVVFAGSGSTGFPSLEQLQRRWSQLALGGHLVFAEDASGAPFCLGRNGSVYLTETEPPFQRRQVAPTFTDFLDQVLMGPRYLEELFPYGSYPDNNWLAYLQEKGWSSPSGG